VKGYRVSTEKKCIEHVAEQEKMKVRKVGLGSNQEGKKSKKKEGRTLYQSHHILFPPPQLHQQMKHKELH
jgi:hypothetical protein